MLSQIREDGSERQSRGMLLIILQEGFETGGTEKDHFFASGLSDPLDVELKSIRIGTGPDIASSPLHSRLRRSR